MPKLAKLQSAGYIIKHVKVKSHVSEKVYAGMKEEPYYRINDKVDKVAQDITL
jgi:hypothetical protein